MGLSYGNLTVYRVWREPLLVALRRLRRTGYIGPPHYGRVVIFDPAVDELQVGAIDRLGRSLSGVLKCSALAAALHDDAVLRLWLFERGELIDRDDSCPRYFDPRADEPAPPAGGNAAALSSAFGRPEREEAVERLLRAALVDGEEPELSGEVERHAALAGELGIPGYVAGLGHSALAGGYVPGPFQGLAFEPI